MNPFRNYLQNFGSNSFLNQWIFRHDPRLAMLEEMVHSFNFLKRVFAAR